MKLLMFQSHPTLPLKASYVIAIHISGKNLSTGAVQRQTYKNQVRSPRLPNIKREDEIFGSPKKTHTIQTWETPGGI